MAIAAPRRAAPWTRVLPILALSALLVRAAAAQPLELAYQVAWGHVTVAEATLSHAAQGERYTLSGEGRTEGLLGWLFDWRGAARTEGLVLNGEPRPLHHSHEGTLKDKRRQTRVDWSAQGVARAINDPPLDEAKVTPVPAASTLGTADPFTVLLRVLDTLKRTGRCEVAAKVWDGRLRYDLVVEHLGAEDLVADRPWSYSGPSVKCRLRVARIGGFRREASSWRTKDDTGERAIWAADIGAGRYVPVRAELDTAFGTIVGRLRPGEAREDPTKQAEARLGFTR